MNTTEKTTLILITTATANRKAFEKAQKGVAKYRAFNEAVDKMEDAFLRRLSLSSAKRGTTEFDLMLPEADADYSDARSAVYAWVDDLIEAARHEGEASGRRKRRIH